MFYLYSVKLGCLNVEPAAVSCTTPLLFFFGMKQTFPLSVLSLQGDNSYKVLLAQEMYPLNITCSVSTNFLLHLATYPHNF